MRASDPNAIDGRNITEFPGETTGMVSEYAKTATVLAAEAMRDGVVATPEGVMTFHAGDFIVTDNPPTHCWPVKREVFLATYIEGHAKAPHPGEQHRFRTACEDCGELGVLNITILGPDERLNLVVDDR